MKIPRVPMYMAVATIVPSALVYVFTKPQQLSDEEMRRELETKYPHLVRRNKEQEAKMKEFFRKMRSNDEEQQQEFREVLYSGKAKIKRQQYYEGPGSEKDDGAKSSGGAGLA